MRTSHFLSPLPRALHASHVLGSREVICDISIIPATMRLVIQPSPLLNDSCETGDMNNQGLQLNESLPFNLTSTNMVMLLKCDPIILASTLNYSSRSLCHTYINEAEAAMACRKERKRVYG